MIILQIITGAILNRWRGSGRYTKTFWLNFFIKSKTPKLIFMAIVYGAFLIDDYTLKQSLLSSLWLGGFMTIGWGMCYRMGGRSFHGQPERAKKWYYRWLVRYMGINDKDWTYEQCLFRDYLFMTMRGLWNTAGVGIILGSPLIAVSGAGMGIIYMIGRKNAEKWKIDSTTLCELLYGGWLFIFV